MVYGQTTDGSSCAHSPLWGLRPRRALSRPERGPRRGCDQAARPAARAGTLPRAHVLHLQKLTKDQGGVRGILVQGSNGEAQLLSHEERKTAIRITRETLDNNGFKDTVILAGTGAQSTKETIKLCKDAAEAGADFALTLTPSTWPKQMTQANIVRFFHTVRSHQKYLSEWRIHLSR